MEGFTEVTNEELKKNILDYANALGKDWDGDILFYHDNIFYVRLDTGYVAVRDYGDKEEKDVKDSAILQEV